MNAQEDTGSLPTPQQPYAASRHWHQSISKYVWAREWLIVVASMSLFWLMLTVPAIRNAAFGHEYTYSDVPTEGAKAIPREGFLENGADGLFAFNLLLYVNDLPADTDIVFLSQKDAEFPKAISGAAWLRWLGLYVGIWVLRFTLRAARLVIRRSADARVQG